MIAKRLHLGLDDVLEELQVGAHGLRHLQTGQRVVLTSVVLRAEHQALGGGDGLQHHGDHRLEVRLVVGVLVDAAAAVLAGEQRQHQVLDPVDALANALDRDVDRHISGQLLGDAQNFQVRATSRHLTGSQQLQQPYRNGNVFVLQHADDGIRQSALSQECECILCWRHILLLRVLLTLGLLLGKGSRHQGLGQTLHRTAQGKHRPFQPADCLTQLAHLLLQLFFGCGIDALHSQPLLHHALHSVHEGALKLLEHRLRSGLEGRQQT
mmetsp:Transcript_24917/g.42932  ORF Transcript_24917/g.42932 Transcript_24917/m.42932 type:complete len:267 (+) Transcript_24917:107-907(+)